MRAAWKTLWLSLWLAQAVIGWAQDDGGEVDGAAAAARSQYLEMKPSFVTNYGGPGPLHYLKADIVLRIGGGEPGMLAVRHHMPRLRHELVMLLSRQLPEDIATMEGKELLRQQSLAAIRGVLEGEEGRPYVEDLLFNNFIIQR